MRRLFTRKEIEEIAQGGGGGITPEQLVDSETIVVDEHPDNTIDFNIETSTLNKINNSLQCPSSAPMSTELVGIDPSKSQQRITLGDGLTLTGNVLSAAGGGGGSTKYLNLININKLISGRYVNLSTLYITEGEAYVTFPSFLQSLSSGTHQPVSGQLYDGSGGLLGYITTIRYDGNNTTISYRKVGQESLSFHSVATTALTSSELYRVAI